MGKFSPLADVQMAETGCFTPHVTEVAQVVDFRRSAAQRPNLQGMCPTLCLIPLDLLKGPGFVSLLASLSSKKTHPFAGGLQ